jgi:hypothetical protein
VHAITEQQPPQVRLPFWQHGLIFLLSCAVLVSRRPDAIFHAQFLQEDGHTWFADAYNFGWWAGVCRTYEGCHHVFPRLGAAIALLVPLALAPLVLNCIAIAVQVLPVNLLLSSRSSAWGNVCFRALLAGVYLALPNTREMLNNISQSQWPLTLCAFLLLVASPPKGIAGRVFDVSIVLLCGLTGPQCAFLFPIALFLAWRHRERWLFVVVGVLAVTCFVQARGLLNGGFSSRPHFALGASPAMLMRILAGHVFLGTLLGGNGLAANSSPPLLIFLLGVALGGIVLVAFSCAKSPLPLKLLLLLTSALLAVSLISPTVYPPAGVSMWQVLAGAVGIRYWYFPTLAFAWLLLWGFQSRAVALMTVSAVLLCVMCFGIIRDWRIPPFQDLHFAEYARNFEAAPPGTAVVFPENPEGWNMRLVKHLPSR